MAKICLLGCGNMTSSLISPVKKAQFFTYTPSGLRAKKMAESIGGTWLGSWESLVQNAPFDIYLLGCKPQNFGDLAPRLRELLQRKESKNSLVVSMLAGVNLERLKNELEHGEIIRIMPNLVAKVKSGSLIIYPAVEDSRLFFLKENSKFYPVDKESDFDRLMLAFGSGPAYVFSLIKALEAFLEKENLHSEQHRIALFDTVVGAVELMRQEPLVSSEDWIKRVASKGGVTEAALGFFAENNLEDIFLKGLEKGVRKSRSIG